MCIGGPDGTETAVPKRKSPNRKPRKARKRTPAISATERRRRLRQSELELGRRPALWTIEELAGRWACSPWTVRRMITRGVLDRVFIGPHMPRIPDESVQRHEQGAAHA
jgi:hypothetical protein